MTPRSAVIVRIYLVTSLGLTGLSYVLEEWLKIETGLVRSVELGVDDERTSLFTRTTSDIDLTFLDNDPELARRFFEVRWDGVWHVPEGLQVDVYAGGDDFVAVRIDDELVLERSAEAGMHTTFERIALDAGLHRLSVHYVQYTGGYYVNVQWAPAGGRPRSFDPERLFPERPDPDQITRNQRLRVFWRLVAAVWIAPPLVYLFWVGFQAVARFGRYRLPGMARRVWRWYGSIVGDRSASRTGETRARQKTWTVLGALIVVLLFGLPLFIGLGSEDLQNDEAIYSYAVDRILETGEWLTPESSPQAVFPGDPGDRRDLFFEKPPLKFWIVTLPIKLGLLPHDEFGLRFWDGVFSVIAFVYVFLIGRRLVDPVCGVAAVFLLFIHSSLMLGHGVRSNVMEAALVLSYAGGIHHFLAWSESDRPLIRRRHIFSMAGWFTLGFMTKFIAVAFLPIVLGVTALCFRSWRQRVWADARSWAVAAGVATILIVPWFAYEYAVYGSHFWDIIFGVHIYDRMRGALAPEHSQAWSYYYAELHLQLSGVGAFGWVGVGGALWLLQSARQRWKGGVLILAWYLVPVGIISMSVAKLYHYTFPFLPPVALIGAYPVSLLARVAQQLYAGSAWAARPVWLRPVRYAASALPVAVLLFAWPVDQYGAMLESLGNRRRPLSALRACLVDEFETLRATSPNTVSRVYVHLPRGTGLTHNYYYYYRVFDQWERLESPSDAELFARLFVPNHRAVTLMAEDDYTSFVQRIGSPELGEELRALAIERRDLTLMLGDSAGGLLGTLPAAVRIAGRATSEVLFVLPPPLSRCVPTVVHEGGVLVRSG